jgi:protein-arginine kinase
MWNAGIRASARAARGGVRTIKTVASSQSKTGMMTAVGGVVAAAGAVAFVSTPVDAQRKSIYDMLLSIDERLGKLENELLPGDSQEDYLAAIAKNKISHPNNLMAKHFDTAYFNSLTADQQRRLLKICASGADNADSGMGCYAMNPEDYDEFKPFFDGVIREYHKIPANKSHVTNWSLDSVKDKLPDGGKLDLTKLGLGVTSMRVRVGRNLADFPLPGAMTKDDRVKLEGKMEKAFDSLIADPNYGGRYYSLTPGNPNQVSDKEYRDLVKAHVMFKDMAADPYLNSAGISSDWPYGRGCYVSEDRGFIVWVGEEDHLRIMCMKKGTVLNDVFDRLSGACEVVEQKASKFAHSQDYGYVTSCPTNLGTGMRASIHIKVPKLTSDGTDAKVKKIAKPLGLSVRGLGGEHTPIGADGTIDLSPSGRLCIEEAEIIVALYDGIKAIIKAENEA